MKESKVEKYLRETVEGAQGLCEKHVSPGRRGVPDRLITWPSGLVELVETKAPKKGPTAAQRRDHVSRARRRSFVTVIASIADVDAFMHSRRDHYRGWVLFNE